MAGRQLRSKKTSESVSSDEFTQYGQAWEVENNSSPENNKYLEQGDSAGKVVAEKTSDVIQDLGNNEPQTVSAEDDVEIPLGQQVGTTSGENMQISTRTGSDASSTQIQGNLLSAIWQAMKEKEKQDEEYRLETKRQAEEYRLETKRKEKRKMKKGKGEMRKLGYKTERRDKGNALLTF
jgi:hypothetical protein